MTGRIQIAALAEMLALPFWCLRETDGRLTAIAGPRGYVRSVREGLLVVLQKPAAALVRRLTANGLLEVARGGELRLARLPTDLEVPLLRDLLGLRPERPR